MRWTEPNIEKDKPIPSRAQSPKKPRKPAPPRLSPWLTFLPKLEVGDSFITDRVRFESARKYAIELGMALYAQVEDHAQERELGTFERARPFDLKSYRIWRVA